MGKVMKMVCDICGKMVEDKGIFDVRINGPTQKLPFKQGDVCHGCMDLIQLVIKCKGDWTEIYGELAKRMPSDEDFEENEISLKEDEKDDEDSLGGSSKFSPSGPDDKE